MSLCVGVCYLLIQIYLHISATYLKNPDRNVKWFSYFMRIMLQNVQKHQKISKAEGGRIILLVLHNVLSPFLWRGRFFFTSLIEEGKRSEKFLGRRKTGEKTFHSIILERETEIFMIQKWRFAKLITVQTK